MQKPKVDPDLAYGLNFTAEDLAANREEYMSLSQRDMLLQKRQERLGKSVLYAAIYFGAALFVLLAAISNEGTLCIFAPIWIALFFVGFSVAANGRMFWRQTNEDLMKGDIAESNGRVILETIEVRRGSYRYEIHLNDSTFEVEKEAFLRFKHLDYYTLYYTPNTRIILSAESMEEN
jgi:hypothetical protein